MWSAEKTQNYLDLAVKLETEAFRVRQVDKELKAHRKTILSSTPKQFKKPYSDEEIEASGKKETFFFVGLLIGFIIGLIYFNYDLQKTDLGSSGPIAPLLVVPIGFIIEVGVASFICAGIGYAIDRHIAAMKASPLIAKNADEHEKWLAYCASREQKIRDTISAVDEEIEINSSFISAIDDMKEAFYSNGPIYEKYRNFPAVCQLQEYFASGRFKTLGDAYNQYELEVRLDQIIRDLQKAVELLEKIEENQRVLYDAIVDVTRSLSNFEESLALSRDLLDQTIANQRFIAVCSMQTATATSLLAQMKEDEAFGVSSFRTGRLERRIMALDDMIRSARKDAHI